MGKRRHSRLYYRNTFLAVTSGLLTFASIFLTPWNWDTLAWLAPLILLNFVIWTTYQSVHPVRRRLPPMTPADFELSFEAVSFSSRDGLRLAAWYVPGQKPAALILVHGSGGGKVTMLRHAQLLAKEGYTLLIPDLRAHGDSDGDTIDGLHEADDLLGAVDYLRGRPELAGIRIGTLGISLGALTALQAARRTDGLEALVLESLGPACLEDHGGRPTTLRRWINYPINAFYYFFGDFMADVHLEQGVLAGLKRLRRRPVLLIACGRGNEIHFNRLFYAAASEPKSLWEVPRAYHGMAFIFEKQAYQQKVCGFFRETLLGVETGSG